MVDWTQIGLAVGGSVAGAYLGVKVTVTRLETQMAYALDEIKSLREDRHEHANLIQDHEARLHFLEKG